MEIAVDAGFRCNSGVNSAQVFFGDGASFSIIDGGWDATSAPLSDSIGEQCALVSKKFTHACSANGDYTVYFSDCCRVSTLVNNPNLNGSYRVDTVVKIGTDLNSVKAQIPAIIGLTKNAMNNIDLEPSIYDPDGDAFTCVKATGHAFYATTAFATVPGPGTSLSVTSDCKLQWDLSGYNPTTPYKWAVTIAITNAKGVRQILDFVVELGSGATQVTCPELGHNHGFVAMVGDHVHAEFTIDVSGAINPTVGGITTQTVGLPASAEIHSPLDNGGSSGDSLPGIWAFHWTVPVGTAVGTYVTNIQWLYPGAGTCLQTIQVIVPNPPRTGGPNPGSFGDRK